MRHRDVQVVPLLGTRRPHPPPPRQLSARTGQHPPGGARTGLGNGLCRHLVPWLRRESESEASQGASAGALSVTVVESRRPTGSLRCGRRNRVACRGQRGV